MDQHSALSYKHKIEEFRYIPKKQREIIASIIEDRGSELLLSKAVDDYVYGTTRSLDIGDYFGSMNKKALWEHAVNRNGDYFDITEIEDIDPSNNLPRFLSFRKATMFMDHKSQSLDNAIGYVFDAVLFKDKYNDMHVTTLFGIDKKLAPKVARNLETHPTRVPVSMGCTIGHSTCTACGKDIYTEQDMCNCLKQSRNNRVISKSGTAIKVAELLRKIAFYELSVVGSPACPTAYVIDAISEIIPGRLLKVASSEKMELNPFMIVNTLHTRIKNASSIEEKQRLARQMDQIIYKLESLLNTRF